jgi:hypothetical protein
MRSDEAPCNPTNPAQRASWLVRVTQTNQYNWVLLAIAGSVIVVLGVWGLIAGGAAGSVVVLLFGATVAGPTAWWVRRATRVPTAELQSEREQAAPEQPR